MLLQVFSFVKITQSGVIRPSLSLCFTKTISSFVCLCVGGWGKRERDYLHNSLFFLIESKVIQRVIFPINVSWRLPLLLIFTVAHQILGKRQIFLRKKQKIWNMNPGY